MVFKHDAHNPYDFTWLLTMTLIIRVNLQHMVYEHTAHNPYDRIMVFDHDGRIPMQLYVF